MDSYKCPCCGSTKIFPANDFDNGQHYGLVEVIMNKNEKPKIFGNNVIPLNVMICEDCSHVALLLPAKSNH